MEQVPVHDTGASSRTSPLVVAVAASVEDRVRLVNQLGDSGPVLIVSSVAEAQELMSSVQPEDAVPSEEGRPRRSDSPAPEVRMHEDRRAVGFGSVEVALTPLEFALLRHLLSEPGRVWRFDELVHKVWRTDHIGDVSQVHAVVKRLRAKLARAGAPLVIEAVRGVGFRLTWESATDADGRTEDLRDPPPEAEVI